MSKFMKVKAVCEYFSVSVATLNRWVKADKLPKHIYINKQRYWRKSDIEECANKMFGGAA